MDASAFVNDLMDTNCPDNVENGVYRFTIELHCRTVEVVARRLAEGRMNGEKWISGSWEIISFNRL
jgi:hypothetical protein